MFGTWNFGLQNFVILSLMMHVSYSILQATLIHHHKDFILTNQHTLAIHQCFLPLNTNPVGEQL